MDRQKTILIILLVLMVIVLVYYFYFSGSPEAVSPEETNEFSVLSPDEQKQLAEFRKIKNLSFDLGLLNDPFFKSLQDIQVPPAPTEPVGRPNPFLPF